MQMSRFWASVWSVVAFLFGVGLLLYISESVASLFGLLPATILVTIVGAVVPLAGTLTYIDWRWNWTPEHIGLARRPDAALWGLGGLGLGVVAALLTLVLSSLLGGRPLLGGISVSTFPALPLFWTLIASFTVELVFRGAVVSRYQADLTQQEVLIAATLTPFAWKLIQSFFGLGTLWTGITYAWMGAMSVALTLIFLRTDSVWLTTGIRFGMVATLMVTDVPLKSVDSSGLIVWGVLAAALLALEWFKHQSMPRRVQPQRGSRTPKGRTVRGPWGPH